MKRSITFLFPLLFIASMVSAQQAALANIGFVLGGDIEMPHGLDHQYLLSTANNVDFDYNDLAYSDGEMVSMDCDNGTFRFNFAVKPTKAVNTEWQFSILSIDGRIDKVHYAFPEEDPRHGKFLEVSAVNKELALEGVYLIKDEVRRSFNFYAGLGTNIGYSHGGKVNVKGFLETNGASDDPALLEEVDLTYDQKNSVNQRLFIQAGMGIKFLKRMEFGFQCRKGFGYRASIDGPFKFTTLKRSIGLSLHYNIL